MDRGNLADLTAFVLADRASFLCEGTSRQWVNRVILTERRSLPLYPDKQTISEPVGNSHLCHLLTLGAGVSGGAKYPHIADQHRATSSRRGKQSTHRNNDFPFSASTFDVG